MNISLGIANGAWETAVSLKHENNTSSNGSVGDWSATYNAVVGHGDVAVNCNYTKSEDWESRMVYVDDAGKIVKLDWKRTFFVVNYTWTNARTNTTGAFSLPPKCLTRTASSWRPASAAGIRSMTSRPSGWLSCAWF